MSLFPGNRLNPTRFPAIIMLVHPYGVWYFSLGGVLMAVVVYTTPT